jgi:hypothetical protein
LTKTTLTREKHQCSAGYETAVPVSELAQANALDRKTTGTGREASMEHADTVLNFKPGGTYSYHCAIIHQTITLIKCSPQSLLLLFNSSHFHNMLLKDKF